jgi:hypothetical protein
MTKTTYWLADPEGTRAPVEGAEARDYLVRVQGWTETGEPDRHDFVWLRHEDPALGSTRMTWEAAQLDAWAGRGWTPGLQPAEGGVVAEPPTKSSPKSGAAGDKKEV